MPTAAQLQQQQQQQQAALEGWQAALEGWQAALAKGRTELTGPHSAGFPGATATWSGAPPALAQVGSDPGGHAGRQGGAS